jgi:7-keto-8-aminopelargonate synthetase-like enzyme
MKLNLNEKGELITSYLKKKEIGYLTGDGPVINEVVSFGGKPFQNFAILDYLCFSTDPRLKEAAIKATEKYGLYTGVSRSYMIIDIYKEAEDILAKVFGKPVVILTRATLAHLALFPLIMGKNDAIILDHFVHATMKTASALVKADGARVEIVRHNNLEKLEEKILSLMKNHEKIWYCVDGIYSMQGDKAPLKDLEVLLNKYDQFHLLADDSHGLSWTGKNGTGFVLNEIDLHPKMVMVSSLGKGFGAGGAIIVCPDESLKENLVRFGAPLIYSGTPSPATIGAIIASAKIHLSGEIYFHQAKLEHLLAYFNKRVQELGLPVYSSTISPVNNILAGNYIFCADITARIMEKGYYFAPAGFPAVPVNNSSFRVVLSNYHSEESIEELLQVIHNEYHKGLKEYGYTIDKIRSFYKLSPSEQMSN